MRILDSRRRKATAAAVVATVALVSAIALAGGGDGDHGDTSSADLSTHGDPLDAPDAAADNTSLRSSAEAEDAVQRVEREPDALEKAVISTGNVALRSKDVEQAAFDVQQVVDTYLGEVTDQKTNTDTKGAVRHVRMVLRIPSEDFAAAFADLQDVADLTSSSSTSEDVTTQVIDTRVRIRAQRRSIARIEVLLDRAESIRDIVLIEAQLTRRQAALDSLEQQQAYLQDQTSMATITVSIERTPAKATMQHKDDDGFVAGLADGWDALGDFGTAVATRTGQVLPFAGLLLVIGLPLLALIRLLRRRGPVKLDQPAAPSAP